MVGDTLFSYRINGIYLIAIAQSALIVHVFPKDSLEIAPHTVTPGRRQMPDRTAGRCASNVCGGHRTETVGIHH
ncbi:hypothetical protein TNCV_4466831 [Trichonephila clavipes]|nr:hypothetical protein TNCV_4466831 [Trichonephila clavipes]